MIASLARDLRVALLTTAIVPFALSVPVSAAPPVPQTRPAVPETTGQEAGQENEEKKKKDEMTPEELSAIEPAVGPVAALGGMNLLAIGGGAAAAGGIAAAAGAGGGGGGDSADGGGSEPAPPPPPPALVPEADAQQGLVTIKAFDAHSRGITGSGIAIGVLDSGIFSSHSEFAGRIAGCYDAESGLEGCDKTSIGGHGTHVAGILGASRNNVGMMGVAYGATILNADIFEDGGFGVDWPLQANAVKWAIDNGARVINNSYGIGPWNDPEYTQDAIDATFHPSAAPLGQQYQNAVNNGVVMVWATGNDSAVQPGLMSALPLFYPEWKEHWVAVTATNTAGTALAGYANRCGDAAAFCIAAPGGDSANGGGILSTWISEGVYAWGSGTSMATPHVTGAVALLLDQFGQGTPTNFSPEQVVDLMFATANKDGIFADAATFGQGLLDLEKATRPDAPSLAFPTGEGFESGTQAVSLSSLTLGDAFGDAGLLALGGRKAGAVDRYGRIFLVDLGTLAETPDAATDGKALLQAFGMGDPETIRLSPRSSVTLSFRASGPDPRFSMGDEGMEKIPSGMSFTTAIAPRAILHIDYGMAPGDRMGLASDGAFRGALLEANDKTVNPYFDFAGRNAFSAGVEASPSFAPVAFRTLAFFSEAQSEDPLYGDIGEQSDDLSGFAGEMSFVSGPARFSLLTGLVEEGSNVLGTESAGAFAMKEGTRTFFAGPSVRLHLPGGVQAFAGWQSGWTDAKAAAETLFSDVGSVRSDSFTAGFSGTGGFGAADRWGLFTHQPLRVSGAQATLNLVEGRGVDGTPVYSRERVDLSPSGREVNVQGFYSASLGGRQSLTGGLMARFEPGHVREAEPEGIALVRYRMAF